MIFYFYICSVIKKIEIMYQIVTKQANQKPALKFIVRNILNGG